MKSCVGCRMTTYVPLLAEDLRALGACPEEVQAVARLWPKGVIPTPKNLARARRAKLSLEWLAETLDPTCCAPRRAVLYAEFDTRLGALSAEFRALWAALDAEYWPRRAALFAEFAQRRSALAYDVLRACWPVWDEKEDTP